jgi:type I restriction enzyme S subunit
MQEIEKKKSEMRGDVPEGWVIKKLETLAVIQQGISKGKIFKNVETVFYPYLRVANVKDGYFDLSEIKLIQLPVTDLDRYAIEKDDVLITEGGDPDKLGRGSIWNNELERPVFQNHLFRIRSNPKDLIPQFLFNVLQSHRTKTYFLGSAKQTTGIASINSTQVKSTPILLPPISEQRAIADCLSTWDGAIQVSEQLIRQKELQKKWLMQQLLTGKKRLKGFSGEWSERKLGEICKIKKGKSLSSRDLENGVFPVIAGGKSSPYSNSEFSDENVITVSASGAYAGFISFHQYKIWASDCSVIKDVKGVSGIEYLYFLLALNQEKIYKLQTGGAQPHVYPKDLNNFKIFISSCTEEQQAIASILSESDRELDLLRNRLEKIREQKKGLMQVLLTGKRRLRIKEL